MMEQKRNIALLFYYPFSKSVHSFKDHMFAKSDLRWKINHLTMCSGPPVKLSADMGVDFLTKYKN